MIPEAAVEAAAREFYGDAFGDVDGEELKYVLDQMRDTLEAAAPHIAAQAWEAGYGLGYSDHVWAKGHEPRERNPYRAT